MADDLPYKKDFEDSLEVDDDKALAASSVSKQLMIKIPKSRCRQGTSILDIPCPTFTMDGLENIGDRSGTASHTPGANTSMTYILQQHSLLFALELELVLILFLIQHPQS